MKVVALFCLSLAVLAGCKSSAPGSSMSPVQAAECDVEIAVTSAFASAVSVSFSCTNQPAIQASLQTALGNVNFCANSSVSSVTAAQIRAKKAQAVKAMGIVGNVVCPLAINTILGFATAQIPAAWGCTASPQASSVSAALTAACEAAIPL